MDHKQAIEKLVELENSINTSSLKHRGIHYWPFVRLEVWAHLMRQMMAAVGTRAGINDAKAQTSGATMPTADRIDAPEQLTAVSADLPFLFRSDTNASVLDLPLDFVFLARLEDYSEHAGNGQYNRVIDPLYDIAKSEFNCLKIEPFSSEHITFKHSTPSLFAAFEELRKRVPQSSPTAIEGFEKTIESVKSAVPDLEITEDWLSRRIDYCLTMAAAARYVFERLRPKAVFLSCHYSPFNMAVTMACRILGILAIDVQHGRRGTCNGPDTHLTAIPENGYEVLPDIFWCWDQASCDSIENSKPRPSAKPRAVIGGNAWASLWKHGPGIQLSQAAKNFLESLKQKKVILVSFQPESHPLTQTLLDAMRQAPDDWFWLLRTHPLRRGQQDDLEAALALEELTNFDVKNASNLPLFALLTHTTHHVTKWSSTALEALEFGVPTTLIDTIGAQVFESQVRDGLFSLTSSGSELLQSIEVAQHAGAPIGNGGGFKMAEPNTTIAALSRVFNLASQT